MGEAMAFTDPGGTVGQASASSSPPATLGNWQRSASQAADAGPSSPPSVSLPKGGGAIRDIGEKFTVNAATGTASLSVPLATSPGRAGFGPSLSLTYDSGTGNGPFGLGWNLALPTITRKTDRGLPRYLDDPDHDTFILSGAEDLVPVRAEHDGTWVQAPGRRVVRGREYEVQRYRPRVEGLFARIERWRDLTSGETHWRSITSANLTTLYGTTAASRIADPQDPAHVFSWLISASYDDTGNVAVYEYAPEDSAGVPAGRPSERNRSDGSRSAGRYPKRIRYGNRLPSTDPSAPAGDDGDWMFEVVFDYGDHDEDAPLPEPDRTWPARPDAFSSYRPGFELRTYRRCRRVLMFHHFPGEPEVGPDCLVGSTDLTYAELSGSGMSALAAVTHTGYRRKPGGGYRVESLPPLEFRYSQAVIGREVRDLHADALDNLPVGIDGTAYQLVDLDGEGLSGVLARQGGAWYYRANLGDGRFAPQRMVAVQPGRSAASPGNGSRQELLDLAGDGHLDLAELGGPMSGVYERTADRNWHPFRPFPAQPGVAWDDPELRLVDLDGDGLADVMITGDDAITWYPSLGYDGFGPARRAYHPWGEERGPRLMLADPAHAVYLADMSGDGLSDLVRVRNGEVCYWPNLGFGRFGAKVTMDRCPPLDEPERFDQRRVRLADVDGTGTADLIYLHSDGTRLYLNQSGNGFSEPHSLPHGFPWPDGLAEVMVADLLGRGTSCLTWSSPLPSDSGRQLRYLDLLAEGKPYLLTDMDNNLGAETRISYAPSTQFYLADQAAGRPWATRLPFPVHVVDQIETIDRINRTRFTSRYTYHHGYYDGYEREFRGFGLVEHLDTEELAVLEAGCPATFANTDPATDLPPVLTRTWLHTGVFPGEEQVTRLYAHEYYRQPGGGDPDLPDTALPATLRRTGQPRRPWRLSRTEAREACRALKGAPLREELYALDGTAAQHLPYTVTEHNYTIELLQPGTEPRPDGPQNYHAVFFAHPRETVTAYHERALYPVEGQLRADPRITHDLILAVDDYGHPLRSASVAYGRRHPDPALGKEDQDAQRLLAITCTVSTFTNPVERPDAHRIPMPSQASSYEVVGLLPRGNRSAPDAPVASGAHGADGGLFGFAELTRELTAIEAELPYQDWDAARAGRRSPARRLIARSRVRYRADDLSGPLPDGFLEPLALPFQSYRQAFTDDLAGHLYGDLVDAAALSAAGYLRDGDVWWLPSGKVSYSPVDGDDPASELAYARRHFFLPHRFHDPFGNVTAVSYDRYDLLIKRTRDPLGNLVTAGSRDADGRAAEDGNDYRVLAARLLSDPNRNRSAVAFDTLGRVCGTAVMGKPEERLGDSLDGFDPDPDPSVVAAYFADPYAAAHRLLGQATTRVLYDPDAYRRTRDQAKPQPAGVAVIARETHASDLAVGEVPEVQCAFSYSDGFGREIQHKAQAAPGPVADDGPDAARRWTGSGWTVFNNKGLPVRKYEPFFTAAPGFEFARTAGVSSVLFYDPVGRVVATLHPDDSYDKATFDPWHNTTWDVNDTLLLDPRDDPHVLSYAGRYLAALGEQPSAWATWYQQRIDGALGRDQQRAAEQTVAHAGTPARNWLDSLGRTFLTVTHNRVPAPGGGLADQFCGSRSLLDIQGNAREVRDSLGRAVARYGFSMLSAQVTQAGMDTGGGVLLPDVTGKAVYSHNSRGFSARTEYDALRRPVRGYVAGPGIAGEALRTRADYGEDLPGGEANNLRTRLARQYDGAGVVVYGTYDFKGNLLRSSRQLAAGYRDVVDWAPEVPLEERQFRSSNRYDALDRPVAVTAPDGSVLLSAYNQAGQLDRVDARLRGALRATTFVAHMEYNARGQRTEVRYGNGCVSAYAYDPVTFRLAALTTQRRDRRLQDLSYTYDPVGNPVIIRDRAQRRIFFRNRVVDPSAAYTYDALYRLIRATGREHLAQTAQPVPPGAADASRTGLLQPGDGTAMARYVERYRYDEAGNLLRMAHRSADQAQPGWTRDYRYREPSLLEPRRHSNRLTGTGPARAVTSPQRFSYDEQGNTTMLPNLPVLRWDDQDQLHATARQPGQHDAPETTYYVYDTSGQRVRKATERAGHATRKSERVYLGPVELYREYAPDGTLTLERETLHVFDDTRRVALVETRTEGTDQGLPELIRYQLANHLDSSVLELDESGQVITYEEYYPYGSTSYQSARSHTETPKRYRYTAKERDTETGLYYHGARYYAPWLARWTSCDPAGMMGDQNLYWYGAGNPLRFNDPSGLDPNDLLSPDQVGEGPEYSYSAVNPDTGKYDKVSSGGPMVINDEAVAPEQYASYTPPSSPAQTATPEEIPSTAPAPSQTIAQKREEDWSVARAGMWNRAVDIANSGLQMAMGGPLLGPGNLLDWAKAAPPVPTGNELRDYELRENYEAGGTFVDAAQAALPFVPAAETAEGAMLVARRLGIGPALGTAVRVPVFMLLTNGGISGVPAKAASASKNLSSLGIIKEEEKELFSIIDWTGWPKDRPKPAGPFWIVPKGPTYDASRSAANEANYEIRAKSGLQGSYMDIHETQPVKFGGNPTDWNNKELIPRPDHWEVSKFWNKLLRDIGGTRK
jgi:RHS repeat-associated protein